MKPKTEHTKSLYYTLVGYPNRYTYWSSSWLARKIRSWAGMEKPGMATMGEWREWRETQGNNHPIVYWITEEGFNLAQDILVFPADIYRNVKRLLYNIFIAKSHMIKCDLPLGEYSDCDTRIVHGLFQTVIDFVEIEKAHMQQISCPESATGDGVTDGLAYLNWEIDLVNEDETLTQQSEAAREIRDIYLWIKLDWPERPDPSDISGWSEYCDTRDRPLLEEEPTEFERAQVKHLLDKLHQIEQQYDDEDTEMLIRIIKIRKGLWT